MGDGTETKETVVEDTALVRYVGQSYSVEVPYRYPAEVTTLARDFRAMHEQLYGFSTEEDWELEAIRVTASTAMPPQTRAERETISARCARTSPV